MAAANHATEIITTPGLYFFGSDIIYEPTTNNEAILQISASNVTINLDNHTLSQLNTNTYTGTIGILIDQDLTNIVIENGQILDLPQGVGIRVLEGNFDTTLRNIDIIGAGKRGISCEGTALHQIGNAEFIDVRIIDCSEDIDGDCGILFENCKNAAINNTTVHSCGNSGAAFDAFKLINCSNFEFYDCDIKNNTGSTFNGLSLTSSLNNIVERTRAINNSSGTGSCFCFTINTGSNGNTFSECLAQSNISTTTIEVAGFVVNGATACALLDCTARSNIGSGNGSIVYGFKSTDNTTLTADGCAASHNQQTNSGNTYGFYWNNTNRSILSNSVSESNSGDDECCGIYFSSCNDCHIRNNESLYNIGINFTRGLRLANSPNHVALSNVAFSNGTTGTEQISGLNALETSDLNTGIANLAAITYPWINIRAFNP
jgi:hypothetical protein